MKILKKTLILLFVGLLSSSFAQDLNEAGTAFNDGNEAYKAKKYAEAVNYYKSSIDACQLIGGDAADLQLKVEAQIVNAYYKKALTLYKGKKFDEAVAELETTIKAAENVDNASIAKKAKAYIPKVYSSQGMGLLKAKKYDESLAIFDKALKYKEECVNAYYGQGLALKAKGDIDGAVVSFDNALLSAEGNPKAAKTVKKVKNAGQKMLESNAAKELQIEHTEKAIGYLNASLKYGSTSANTYYMLALAYNKQKKYDDAIKAANDALAIEQGDASNIQFELGKSYEAKGKTALACTAYNAVVSGPNVKAAQFQNKEVLKCN
ncbi:MAG: tetratricopeptide repeat protein [Bacteroidales bacterium]|nr:tetratricopeptide repeat protein [Bacteroidales bacterium]